MITKFDVGGTIYIPATIGKIEVGSNKEPRYSMTAKYVRGVLEIDEEGILRNCLTPDDVVVLKESKAEEGQNGK